MGRVAAALRALTGRGPRSSALLPAPESPVAKPVAAPAVPAAGGDEAAARIDAARERLRATIAPPDDGDDLPENEKRGP